MDASLLPQRKPGNFPVLLASSICGIAHSPKVPPPGITKCARNSASNVVMPESTVSSLALMQRQSTRHFDRQACSHAGAWLSNRLDLEVMSCGRSADDPTESLRLEMAGRFLAYDITLDGGFVSVSAQPMDKGDPPEMLLKVGDTLPEWRTMCKLMTALKRNQIKTLLPRPLEIGGSGPDAFVIGD
jgi:hypothetical protein